MPMRHAFRVDFYALSENHLRKHCSRGWRPLPRSLWPSPVQQEPLTQVALPDSPPLR